MATPVNTTHVDFTKPADVRLVMGKQSVRKTIYASEPGFVAEMNAWLRQLEGMVNEIFVSMEANCVPIMLQALYPTFEKSQMYCPIDTGELRASGYLKSTAFRGEPRVEMGYGWGGEPPYTVYVHEMTGIAHKPPTRAKFLESALFEDSSMIYARINNAFKTIYGGP